MTLQQLQYIIAVEKFRSFAKAAEYCGVSQPTLSKLIANLEDELDVRIFDRSSRRVAPTSIGIRIIRQAEKAVAESRRINEIVEETRDSLSGNLRMSVGPGIAPYILPGFIRTYGAKFPEVSLSIEEMRPDSMAEALYAGNIDMAVATQGIAREGILEIPLYTEAFWVYLAESCMRRMPKFTPDQLSHENMWVMKEAQCLRESAFSFCNAREKGRRVYEAGNIETLIRVVDANGGFTIIPEMHLPMLSDRQRNNVRPLESDFRSMRRICLYIRHDYVKERMLNSVIASITEVVPERMLDPYILKGSVRL